LDLGLWLDPGELQVEISEVLLALFRKSRLGSRPVEEQVPWALAIHLLQEGIISTGKAAVLAGEPRATFEPTVREMGIPVATYAVEDYRQDSATIERLRQKDP